MLRTRVSIAAAVLLSAVIVAGPALSQTPAPAPAPAATTTTTAPAPKTPRFARTREKLRLTRERLHEMRVKWQQNRPKLRACRKEVKRKGLAGDDRWFFIEECMEKA